MNAEQKEVAKRLVNWRTKANMSGHKPSIAAEHAMLAVLDDPLQWPATVMVAQVEHASCATVVFSGKCTLHLIDGDLVKGSCNSGPKFGVYNPSPFGNPYGNR